MNQEVCSLRMATVVRGGQTVLDAISFAVGRGEAVVIQGANGAGKTTVLRVLAGLVSVTSGSGTVLGRPLPIRPDDRRRLACTLDEPALWPWLTAPATLRTVCDLAGEARCDTARLLDEVGLDVEALGAARGKRVRRFSQGMRKRLQVACALALPADLLLLDEPTSTLDPAGSRLIWEALERRRTAGAAIVIASHATDAAVALNAEVLRLEGGSVVASESA